MRASIVLLLVLYARAARAEDIDTTEDDFDTLAFQLGAGIAMVSERDARFDGTLRLGKIWGVGHHAYLGGFAELHTLGFSTMDAAAGLQLQREVGEIARLQLRVGVGAGDAGPLALAGVQLGHAFLGANVTGRRDLSTGETTVSINVEVQPLMILFMMLLRDSD